MRFGVWRAALGKQAAEEVYEPVEIDGFCEVGIAPGGERLGAVFGLVMRGEGDDEHVAHGAVAADAARGLDAVDVRQAYVHEDDVGAFARGRLDALHAVRGLEDAEAALLQFDAHEKARVLEIFDDQHLERRGLFAMA